ncbi:hypothetical protein LTR94_029804, partial [Friedmanniomyces endolithicus]
MAQIWAAGNVAHGYRIVNGRRTIIQGIASGTNPYDGIVQSRDLREISTSYDPKFRASNDIYQFNLEYDFTPYLKFTSQTTYAKDYYWSTQDYMRYVSNEVF